MKPTPQRHIPPKNALSGALAALCPRRPRAGFTLLEIIMVLVVVGIIMSLVLSRMNRSTNPDAVTDLDSIRSIVRLAQIKSMGDATVAWTVAVNGRTVTLSQGATAVRTYSLRSSFSAMSVGFDNKGRPQNSTGTWPFTINATTGYIQ